MARVTNPERRIAMLEKLAPKQDFSQAYLSGMSYVDICEMFELPSPSACRSLAQVYHLPERKRGGNKILLPTAMAMTDELAVKVVEIATEQLMEQLDVRIKMVIARALHEAAEAISE